MRNIKLLIDYDGTNYQGWQVQPKGPTLQGILEEKLGLLTGESIHLIGSGRTDAGVHAIRPGSPLQNPEPNGCPFDAKGAQ